MNRIYAVASWFLGSLGVALLLISILLVPQSRALAGTAAVCVGIPCNTLFCTAAFPDCPNVCKVGAFQRYCQCLSDAANCADCICKKNPGDQACDCFPP